MFCSLLSVGAMAASGQYEVTADKLNFRAGASTSSESIAMLTKGTAVTVLSASDGWAKARWNGKTGYLSEDYIQRVTDDCVSGKHTTKLSGTAHAAQKTYLYRAADTSSEKLMDVAKNAEFSLKGETMKFYYVELDDKTGYILKSQAEAGKAASGESSADKAASGGSGLLKQGMENESVRSVQEKLVKLGYLSKSHVTGYFGELTHAAVTRFQAANGLSADGVVGPETMKKLDSGKASSGGNTVVEMDWFDSDVASLVKKRGGTAYIIDCKTGTRINIRRVGGYNHMDVEPATADDTEKLLSLYGGHWSWNRRAVVLVAGGKYIAASINGMPHGDEISTTNNFEGQFCLHTTNSRTHGTDKVDSQHQSCIKQALKYLS